MGTASPEARGGSRFQPGGYGAITSGVVVNFELDSKNLSSIFKNYFCANLR
jgi:hypothetical protein